MNLKSMKNIEMAGKSVLVRVDLNVPMHNGRVSDDTRIRAIIPTIRLILEKAGKPLLLSHFGRPKAGVFDEKFSTAPLIKPLTALLNTKIHHSKEIIGENARNSVASLKAGEVLLFENTRFYQGETSNDATFTKELASLGDIFISDAFSAAHRAHASVVGLANALPSAAGLLMEREISALSKALSKPQSPVMAIVGGAKISTKLTLLENLIQKMDYILLGGAMANTCLAAQGYAVGQSLIEKDMLEIAHNIMKKAQDHRCEIILPLDIVAAQGFKAHAYHENYPLQSCPDDFMILDMGAKTIAHIHSLLPQIKTLIWNGPLGAFEIPPFDKATYEISQAVANETKNGGLLSVAGGGDTVAALQASGAAQNFSYISTAGGAFLEWMEGKTLPGIEPLINS